MMQPAVVEMTRCRFGLIGNHSWGRLLAEALTARGASLLACAGPAELRFWAAQIAPGVEIFADASAVISYPELDLLVLADSLPYRGQLLLEMVQLDRSVLVVHPAAIQPELFYTVQLALQERRFAVWPFLPHRFFAACQRVISWLKSQKWSQKWHLEAAIPVYATAASQDNMSATSPVRLETSFAEVHPVWFWADWLRLLGGEVAEIYAIGEPSELLGPTSSITLTGRWEQGGDFVLRFAPGLAERFCLQARDAHLEWRGPTVLPGEVCIRWQMDSREETQRVCEDSVWQRCAQWILQGEIEQVPVPTWDDAVACAELVQAASDSLRSRKTVPLLHYDYTEAVVFKSRAATLGCGALWLILGLVMLAPLFPQVLYLVPIVLLCSLAMFLLGWLAYRRPD